MFIPLGGVSLCSWETLPRLNADKVQRFLGRGPDQGVREVGDIADDAAARVLLDDRNMRTAQVDHGVAVVVKQVVGQLESPAYFSIDKNFFQRADHEEDNPK